MILLSILLLASGTGQSDPFPVCRMPKAAVRWMEGGAAVHRRLRRTEQCFLLPATWKILSSDETKRVSKVVVRMRDGRMRTLWSPARIGEE